MSSQCAACGCSRYNVATSGDVLFHMLPLRNIERCKQWLAVIRNPTYNVNTPPEKYKDVRVCSLHFKPEDYKNDLEIQMLDSSQRRLILKEDAVPSVFECSPEIIADDQTSTNSAPRNKICLVCCPDLCKVTALHDHCSPNLCLKQVVASDDDHRSTREPSITSEIVITLQEEESDSSEDGQGEVGEVLQSDETGESEETIEMRDSDTEYSPGPKHTQRSIVPSTDDSSQAEDSDCIKETLKHRQLCPECGMFCRNLKTHMCQFKIKPYSCNLCGKRFVHEKGLKAHSKKHEDGNEHQCQFCVAIFKTRPEKLAHEQTHSSKRPYECPECPETFANFHTRLCHMSCHTVCKVCNKNFAMYHDLRRHMIVHTGVKPYVCDVCQRSFSQGSHLKSHMRVHTGEKPFKCLHCDKSFTHNVSLKSHIQRYHQVPDVGPPQSETDKDDMNTGNVEESGGTQDNRPWKRRSTGRPIGRPKKNAGVSGLNMDPTVPPKGQNTDAKIFSGRDGGRLKQSDFEDYDSDSDFDPAEISRNKKSRGRCRGRPRKISAQQKK